MVGTRSRRKSAVLEPAPEEGVPTTPPVKKPRKRAATIEAAPEVVLPPALIDASIIQAFRSEDDIRVAAEHVMLMDPVLMPILEEHGHPTKLLKQQEHSVFQALVRSIIFQQLHGKAATAIYERVLGICKNPITPAAILGAPPLELRGCGLSERKVEYLTCLATRFTESNLSDDEINKMSDQELKDELTKVKGIGPWSVDMLMMFNLGRVNVLPVGDLAVRKGMQQLYKLSTLPTPVQMETIARRWEPYRSIGTYLMWRIPTPKQSPKPKTIKSAAKSFPSAGRV